MWYGLRTFQELNVECAKRFLQHAVVVDNGLYFVDADEIQKREKDKSQAVVLTIPGKRSPKRKGRTRPPVEIGDQNDDAKKEKFRRDLNAQKLVESFARQHIICCPYRPKSNAAKNTVVRTTLSVAKNADIVVIDWDLGGGGGKALEVIKELLALDQKSGGRLRLIAIYTGAKEVSHQFRQLCNVLDKPVGANEPKEYVINGEKYRVIFLNKENTALTPIEGVEKLSEDKLCDRLVDEFSKMTDGLMPNVALTAISEIREATHRILAKYDGALDPALLTHRALLRDPHESEDFVVQLVSDEIVSILQAGEIGSSRFGAESIGAWLTDQADKRQLKIGLNALDENRFTVESALRLLTEGLEEGPNLDDEISVQTGKNKKLSKSYVDKIKNNIGEFENLFAVNERERNKSHQRVARYSVLAREAFGESYLPANWVPVLTLGSIVKTLKRGRQPEYFVCLQPVCDCVRVSKLGQNFPFIRLNTVSCSTDTTGQFDVVVVHDKLLNILCLKQSYKPSDQALFKFSPTDNQGVIKAAKERGRNRFVFTDTHHNRFLWLGDMKTVFAIRDAERVSNQLSRVGMSEFEWLRLRSSFS